METYGNKTDNSVIGRLERILEAERLASEGSLEIVDASILASAEVPAEQAVYNDASVNGGEN